MATRSSNTVATWNRDDRDLLIELKTNMQNTRDEVAAARVEIKDINTGITSRLLNLEANAVSKIELSRFDECNEKFEARLRTVEDQNASWLGKQNLIAGALGIIAGLIGSLISSGHF
jgi:hypothetical protein